MDVLHTLSQCRLFASLDAGALERLAALCTVQDLAGGEPLFAAGAPADHLYIVASGRLRALRGDGGLAGDICRFEPIGEISLLTGEPRSGEVYALRDSQLLCIERTALLDYVALHPSALLELTRVVIGRLRRNQHAASPARQQATQTLAFIAADATIDLPAFSQRVRAAMAAPPVLIDAESVDRALGPGAAQSPFDDREANGPLLDWLAWREAGAPRLLFCAGAPHEAWSERCLRQADRIVIVARAERPVGASALPALLRRLRLRSPIDLVLLRGAGSPVQTALAWREACGAAAHHYIDQDRESDYTRLGRLLSGTGLGLVLGGGGARGFAHIGLVRALEELGRPIDLVGGSSMGAFFSALLARGADSHTLREIARASFVDHNYLNDFVLPRVSLIRGRRFLGHLRSVFGDARIEDLPLPFFCVSANLTRGSTMIHDEGPLATWVATSMAVPGVAPPLVWRGDLLADGSIVNSLPTDIMQNLARGPVIASDVSTDGGLSAAGIEGPDPEALLGRSGLGISLTGILFRSATLSSESSVRARAARADVYLRMPVSRIGLFDWKQIDAIIDRGYQHALATLSGHFEGDARPAG